MKSIPTKKLKLRLETVRRLNGAGLAAVRGAMFVSPPKPPPGPSTNTYSDPELYCSH